MSNSNLASTALRKSECLGARALTSFTSLVNSNGHQLFHLLLSLDLTPNSFSLVKLYYPKPNMHQIQGLACMQEFSVLQYKCAANPLPPTVDYFLTILCNFRGTKQEKITIFLILRHQLPFICYDDINTNAL